MTINLLGPSWTTVPGRGQASDTLPPIGDAQTDRRAVIPELAREPAFKTRRVPLAHPGAKCPCQGFKTRRKVADSKIVHTHRLPDSWADLHMKATDLVGRSIFVTESRGFRRCKSDRRNSRVILTDRYESRADLGGNRCRNSSENLSGIRFALVAFRDLQVMTKEK